MLENSRETRLYFCLFFISRLGGQHSTGTLAFSGHSNRVTDITSQKITDPPPGIARFRIPAARLTRKHHCEGDARARRRPVLQHQKMVEITEDPPPPRDGRQRPLNPTVSEPRNGSQRTLEPRTPPLPRRVISPTFQEGPRPWCGSTPGSKKPPPGSCAGAP
jgi:hypothetical protein